MATAELIINRVRTQLIDTGPAQRWSDEELLRWVSDGQRMIALAVPSAVSKRVTVQLIEGTLQELPATATSCCLLFAIWERMGKRLGERSDW